MAEFEKTLDWLHEIEGGLADDPDDPGGVTAFGWSLRALQARGIDIDGDGDVDRDDVLALYDEGRETSDELFRREIWDAQRYGEIEDQTIANKIFDEAVNMGEGAANAVAQRVLVSLGFRDVAADGVVGQHTLAALNAVDPEQFLPAFRAAIAAYYRDIVRRNPRLEKYLRGWLRRAAH